MLTFSLQEKNALSVNKSPKEKTILMNDKLHT
jgi:hypothetical protein